MGVADELHSLLAALARYVGADRLYTLELAGTGSDWVVERWQGWEALSCGYEWWVDALSVDAQVPLGQLLGQRATLHTRLADGSRAARSGLVREAECVGADGGLARYRLCLVPWTWLLTQGRHSRVFQDKTVAQILDAVFAAYAPLAAWQWGEEVGPFLAQVRPRSYCVQYRESDFDFVSRLLAEEGLGWRVDEDGEAPGGHRLMLFAQSGDGPQDASAQVDGSIRFHRSDATETRDTIQALGSIRHIGSSALTLLSADYKTVQVTAATLPIGDHADEAVLLEQYDPVGVYAFASRAEAERHAGLMAEAQDAACTLWLGRGTARSFRAGHWFTLTDAPSQGETPPDEILLVQVQHAGVNNLPKTVREAAIDRLGTATLVAACGTQSPLPANAAADWPAVLARADAVGYANRFTAVPRGQRWRPVLTDGTGARLNPRPTAPGYQTARVVGSNDAAQVLHGDALGRVKVRFHFQEGASGEHESSDSCWLRVAQRYAGPGVGSQFLPRIGQEVLVAFLEGDIDRPVIIGTLYNGQGEAGIVATPGGKPATTPNIASLFAQASDHNASAQANLAGGHAPPWHGMGASEDGHRNAAALLGIKSQEFGGKGYNVLAFDDSDRQLGARIATTQSATALNLGHLIHQADNYRGSFRGEGFELRTDAWGVVRAQAGLWLSAYPRDGDTPAGDAVATNALLKQAEQLVQVFSKAAINHQTVRFAASEGVDRTRRSQLVEGMAPLSALLASARTTVDGKNFDVARSAAKDRKSDAGNGRVPHTGDALLGLSAPAGVGLIAGQSVQWSVGETLTLASGQASNLAIAQNLRVHSGQAIGVLANTVENSSRTSPEPATGDGINAASMTSSAAMSLVAAQGELDLQAQHDQLKLQSRDALKVISANAEIELAAGKTVHLATAGGASITIEEGNITFQCPGAITVHAGKHSFVGPTSLNASLPRWPTSSFDAPCMQAAAETNSAFVRVP
ncbi:Rhs element Vgr protein [Luteimonas cucumeris]|uniref:Rhs element Vgr protein n=1 Tax=Luteimonas cucumeris TaxID=985012 RepID=A0A562LBC9_9GAMM|nr:type VI secretion system Vgr family protein [Luteimonas cucumeris]TWI04764.1 Rhs element Vgr protein [Luteimonas cucumeris]